MSTPNMYSLLQNFDTNVNLEIGDFVALADAVRQARDESGVSRATAALTLAYLDNDLNDQLFDAGLDRDKLRNELGVERMPTPDETVTDIDLKPSLSNAVADFLKRNPEAGEAFGYWEIASAVFQSVEDPSSSGGLSRHLAAIGVDDAGVERLIEAVDLTVALPDNTERHVIEAFQVARALSRPGKVTADAALRAAVVVNEQVSSDAFAMFADMVKTLSGESRDPSMLTDADSLAVFATPGLKASFRRAQTFLADDPGNIWGRDYITIALFATRDASLQVFAAAADVNLADLQSQWLEYVASDGRRRSDRRWNEWWTSANQEGLGGLRAYVRWRGDEAAVEDGLQRRPVARVLAKRLQEVCEDPSTPTFLVHIDGPWGSGKSTLLGFLAEFLNASDPPWLVVPFNAWRNSQAGPAWWALLQSLRDAAADTRWRRASLWLGERWKLLGPRYLTGVVFLVGFLGLIIALTWGSDTEFGLSSGSAVFKSLSTVLSVVAVVWSLGAAVSRAMAWGSPRGAAVYKDTRADPMGDLASHFDWLARKAERDRIVFFIDDLDRCDKKYVVDLLNAVQTLARPPAGADRGNRKLFFVVAADGRWIRRSYEIAHQEFTETVAEPGRPLGYMFLDKLFQLTVPVPLLSEDLRDAFLDALLAPYVELQVADDPGEAPTASDEQIRRRIEGGRTPEEVEDAFRSATPRQRIRLGGLAAEQILRPDIAAHSEHFLMKYSSMLDPNPRSMKRYLLSFDVLWSLRLAEGSIVDRDALARWAILAIRWPQLADALVAHPEAVNPGGQLGTGGGLNDLLKTREVEEVVGAVLDAETILACCGMSATYSHTPTL